MYQVALMLSETFSSRAFPFYHLSNKIFDQTETVNSSVGKTVDTQYAFEIFYVSF